MLDFLKENVLADSAADQVIQQYNTTKLNGPRMLPVAFCFNEKMNTPWNLAARSLVAEGLHHHLKAQFNLRYDSQTMSMEALNKLIPTRVNSVQRSRSQKSQPIIIQRKKAQLDRIYGQQKSVSGARTIHPA